MSGRAPRAIDQLIGCALALAYVAVLLGTANDIGLARDEGIYVDAGERYGNWLELLFRAPSSALDRAQIDSVFRVNHEHPPLMKMLFGLGHSAQVAWHSSSAPSLGFRLAGMLSAGLLLWLLYVFGTRLWGSRAGLFAALVYAFLPRPFYHAHLCAFDVPITLASTAATYAYYRSLTRARLAPLAGLMFGLALLTKHNAWILPGIFALHFGLCAALELWLRKRPQLAAAQHVRLMPFGLIAMLLLGPLVFFAGWPWMWHDTLPRLREYAAFHLHHEYYNMEYFGVNYFWPPFPSSYAWVMTLFTVPFTSLALGVCGAALALKRTRDELRGDAPIDATLPSVLLLGAMLAPLVIISIPSTPIFGGTKHWFPAYPLLALFAGRAFSELCAWLTARTRHARATCAIAAAWLLAPAWIETVHSHPFALSHYTVIAGGVPGAAEKGMNRQFWGYTTRSLVPYLRSVLPEGGTLYVCDTIYTAFLQLIRDGHLPDSFRATGDISRADYALVHHEKHFAEVDHEIWTTYGSVQPAHVLLYDGVPIISVYKNPRGK